jgi:hypothetical protein
MSFLRSRSRFTRLAASEIMSLYGSGARGVATPLRIGALVATLASNCPSLPFLKDAIKSRSPTYDSATEAKFHPQGIIHESSWPDLRGSSRTLSGCNISVCPASDLRNNLGQQHKVL